MRIPAKLIGDFCSTWGQADQTYGGEALCSVRQGSQEKMVDELKGVRTKTGVEQTKTSHQSVHRSQDAPKELLA